MPMENTGRASCTHQSTVDNARGVPEKRSKTPAASAVPLTEKRFTSRFRGSCALQAEGHQDILNYSRRLGEGCADVQCVIFAEDFVEVVDAEEIGEVIVGRPAHFTRFDHFKDNVTEVVR